MVIRQHLCGSESDTLVGHVPVDSGRPQRRHEECSINEAQPCRSWTRGLVGRKLASRYWLCKDLSASSWSHYQTVCLNLSQSKLVGRKGICSHFGCRKRFHYRLAGQKAWGYRKLVCKGSLQNKGAGS